MVELARRVALKTKARKAQQPSYDLYASSGIDDSGGDTRLTAHAHGEFEPRSHDDVRLAATVPISPLGAVGGEGVAGTQTVFRMMLEFFVGGFAQYGALIYAAGYKVPDTGSRWDFRRNKR